MRTGLCRLLIFSWLMLLGLGFGCAPKSAQTGNTAAPSTAEERKGDALLAAGRIDDALGEYAKASRSGAKPASLSYRRAYAFMAKQDWRQALENFQEALNADPGFVLALEGAGLASFELGKLDEAQSYFETTCVLRPDLWLPRAYLSAIYKAKNEIDKSHAMRFSALSLAKDKRPQAESLLTSATQKAVDFASSSILDGEPSSKPALQALAEEPRPGKRPPDEFSQVTTIERVKPQTQAENAEPASAPAKPESTAAPAKPETASSAAKLEPRPEPKPEAKPESKPEASNPAPKPEPEKPQIKLGEAVPFVPSPQNKQASQAPSKPEAKAQEPKLEVKPDSRPDPKPEPAAEAKAKEPAPEKPKAPGADEQAVAKAQAQSGFALLDSSWDNQAKADERAAALKKRGLAVSVESMAHPGGRWYRVILGRYPTYEQAEVAKQELVLRLGLTDTLIVRGPKPR